MSSSHTDRNTVRVSALNARISGAMPVNNLIAWIHSATMQRSDVEFMIDITSADRHLDDDSMAANVEIYYHRLETDVELTRRLVAIGIAEEVALDAAIRHVSEAGYTVTKP